MRSFLESCTGFEQLSIHSVRAEKEHLLEIHLKNQTITSLLPLIQARAFLGVGICIGSMALPAWILLPVFIDHKLAADPSLPGLTDANLVVTTTAIFTGWVVGSFFLQRLTMAFDKAQLIVAGSCGLLMLTVAIVTVPHLTAGNLAVFTALRFIQGLLMNIVFLETIYVQEAMPAGWGNLALVCINVGFCVVDILQAFASGGFMMSWDWRIQAALLYSVPLILALLMGFPNRWAILRSIPAASKTLWSPLSGKRSSTTLSATDAQHLMFLKGLKGKKHFSPIH